MVDTKGCDEFEALFVVQVDYFGKSAEMIRHTNMYRVLNGGRILW